MAQHSSRLERLLTLLDTGSTQATRFAAARQIGEIAKLHPAELNSLLKKVSPYLRSRNWDTRAAAAHAIGAVAENVKHPSLPELFSLMEEEMLASGISDCAKDVVAACSNFDHDVLGSLSFRSFDINKVLEFGSPLVASGGQEYDVAVDNSKTPAERLARQRQNLRQRLGLDVCEQFMDVNDMIRDEDLLVHKGQVQGNGISHGYYASSSGHSNQQLVANMVPSFRPKKLSARELNLLKRKAKINAKDHTKDWCEDDELQMSSSYNPMTPKGECAMPLGTNKVSINVAVDDHVELDGNAGWPFHHFVEQLVHDMFDPLWEVRHGTIMALREIMTHQGACVGVFMPDLDSDMSWLPDMDVNYTKRGKVIDLNTQLTVDAYEPELKRQKVEIEPFHLTGTVPLKKEMDSCLILEDWFLDTTERLDNSNFGIANVKSEPDSCRSSSSAQHEDAVDAAATKGNLSENTSLGPKIDFLANLPQNCRLMKLIKLTRYSWIKNWEFLQDCAIRFLCVLSLDRFGDYVSDQVVAPVRETCSQALGAVLKYMHPSLVHETLHVLLQMQCRQEWEIRHGSLLGVKYLIAVRQDMLQDLLGYVLPACKTGLEDTDDDVRAVAAEALMPTTASLVSLEGKTLHAVVMLLWDILLYLDDLNPSTSSVMNLLAEIYSQPEMLLKIEGTSATLVKQEFDLNQISVVDELGDMIKREDNPYTLSTLAPRLWPFIRHIITSVRHSAIRTLERLLEVGFRRASSEPMASIWPSSILGDTLRIVFQNLILESNEDILHCSKRVWDLLVQCPEEDLEAAAKLYFPAWTQLATTPVGSTLDATKMYWPVALPRKSHFRAAAKMRATNYENENHGIVHFNSSKGVIAQENVDDSQINSMKIIFGSDNEKSVTRTRVATATALGVLASKLPEVSLQVVVNPLWNDVTSSSGVQRQVACMVLIAWFKELKSKDASQMHEIAIAFLDPLRQWLLDLLACSDPSFPTKDSLLPYAEHSRTYTKMRNEASKLFHLLDSSATFRDQMLNFNVNLDFFSIDDAFNVVKKLPLPIESSNGNGTDESPLLDDIELSKQRLMSTSCYLNSIQNNLHVTVSALIAAAVVWTSELPPKLNPIILPLMAAVKREHEEILQQKAAEALSELIFHCIGRKPSPNDKLIKNICSLACMDLSETPQAAVITTMDIIESQDLLSLGRSSTSTSRKTKGRVPSAGEDRSRIEGYISRRGSELSLKYLCEKFGSLLFDKLPKLWDCLTEFLKPMNGQFLSATDQQMLQIIDEVEEPQSLINNIQMVRSIATLVDESLGPKLLTLLPSIILCLRHPHVAVRLAASRCIASMAKSMTTAVMGAVIEKVIPMLGDSSSVYPRQGAGMLVCLLVQGMGVELVAYARLLIVPLLKCMSDCDHAVRHTVTHSFAVLVPLLPLARGLPPPTGLSEDLSKNTEDARFLEQLLDNSQIDDYKLPINLKVALRRYQQEGINWLSFLRRFKLHGILCDDMGLGKTLQASAIVAADIVDGRTYNTGKEHQSLIICPSTLVGHWAYEIEKYVDDSILKTLQYVGSVPERISLRECFDKYNVIITSYDVVRKDIDYLGKLQWNYCILDEGHIIKNSKSKITCGVKHLKAEHRLVLSGTPIQNNVLELWSLFDFLMPGFLGTERQFQATYGKPLLAARDPKCSAKDAEAGALAMEALHKQVMPFLLRRTKDEVLLDLPEKIIQDRYCDLSPVQLKLYEWFSDSDAKKEISTFVKVPESSKMDATSSLPKATSHVFQALQYLLKLCGHPLLVLGEKPPESLKCLLSEVVPGCPDILSALHELEHSPKLVALKEILEECGIGQNVLDSEGGTAVGQHRVLIFAQHRSLLDIIEKDLFHAHMKNVTYLRLDGSVEPEKRFDIVKAFNSDPTIDALLLTTHVGGLGLNLTSADTLVFMEHDWNPMKDHQAMDRAHRLGQRKVVNVHRLIMRGTLEEKVMSLQNFKVSIANAVINADNASLKTMNTDQLLDLFTPAQTTKKDVTSSRDPNGSLDEDPKAMSGRKGLKAMLSGLEELWDQSQYEEEYNLSQFLAKLNH
uniref:TATA-binding protein-associated factor 172 n=1 Tax=Anthurium amnicola TaxID=1678845 RepID=A0A1D1XEI5_9ARAE